MRKPLPFLFLCLLFISGCGGDGAEAVPSATAEERLTSITDATNQLDSVMRKAQVVKELNDRMTSNPALRTKANYQKLVAGVVQLDASFRLALSLANVQPSVGPNGSAFDFAELMAEIMRLVTQEWDTFTEWQAAITDLVTEDPEALSETARRADEIASQARTELIDASRKISPLIVRARAVAYASFSAN